MSDRDYWAAAFMVIGFLSLGYNIGSMAKVATLNSNGQVVVAETQVRGAR